MGFLKPRPKLTFGWVQGCHSYLDSATPSLKTGDRIAQRTSFCFDISVWEIFWTLMEGATICPVKREIVLNPWEFAAWIKKTKINPEFLTKKAIAKAESSIG